MTPERIITPPAALQWRPVTVAAVSGREVALRWRLAAIQRPVTWDHHRLVEVLDSLGAELDALKVATLGTASDAPPIGQVRDVTLARGTLSATVQLDDRPDTAALRAALTTGRVTEVQAGYTIAGVAVRDRPNWRPPLARVFAWHPLRFAFPEDPHA